MNDDKSMKAETQRNPHSATNGVAADDNRREQIAIVAYQKAAARGFAPNHDIEDWLAAEREVTSASEQDVPHVGNSMSTDEFQSGPKEVAGVKDLRSEPPKLSGGKPKR